MVCTYGESWNLFYSDATILEPARQSSSSMDLDAELASASTDSSTTPSHDILAEVQRLRQELNDIKRARSTSNTTDAAKGAQIPAPAPPPNASSDARDSSSDSNLPRCWDPCCNGRTFSNQSNLARHRREKRGEAAKLRCSFCDAAFSRSSARNAHEAEKRCRNNTNKSNDSNVHNASDEK